MENAGEPGVVINDLIDTQAVGRFESQRLFGYLLEINQQTVHAGRVTPLIVQVRRPRHTKGNQFIVLHPREERAHSILTQKKEIRIEDKKIPRRRGINPTAQSERMVKRSDRVKRRACVSLG